MYRKIVTMVPAFAMLSACSVTMGGESRDVGEFHSVENQTDAHTVYRSSRPLPDGTGDPAAAEEQNVIEITCAGDVESDVTTTVDETGTLVIGGQASNACTIAIARDDLESIEVTGDGDVDMHGTYVGLASVVLHGSSTVHIDAVESDELAIASYGSAELFVDDADCGTIDFDLAGTSETTIAGNADYADIDITGDAALFAKDCEFGDADVTASGNATVEATVLGEVTTSVTGSAVLDL